MEKINNKLIFFIVNPESGNGKTKKIFPQIKEYLVDKRIPHQIVYTKYKGHATDIAKQAKKNQDIRTMVAVGGDGTLTEVVNGAYPSDIPIGYIPTGTGNDFARGMGLTNEPIKAIENILKHNVRNIDIGKIDNNYFVNVASTGFDAEIANYANRSRLKKYLGKIVYVLGVVKALGKFKPKLVHIMIDGEELFFENVWLIAVANNNYYGGGMKISPQAINDDGLLDLCIINDLSRLRLLRLFPTIFSGRHIQYPFVKLLRGAEIKITEIEGFVAQSDGEILSNTELNFSVIKQGFKIVT